MKRKVAIALIAIGVLAVFSATALWGYNLYESERAKNSAQDIMQSLLQQVDPQTEDDPFNDNMKVVDIDGYGYIGYLSIPALDLELPIMSTYDYTRLKLAPCRYYGSAKSDNLVIAAHNYKNHFGYIGKLAAGDAVYLTDMEDTVYRYRVTAIEILPPTATDQVKDSGDALVLYTCNYSGNKRIVVRCAYA